MLVQTVIIQWPVAFMCAPVYACMFVYRFTFCWRFLSLFCYSLIYRQIINKQSTNHLRHPFHTPHNLFIKWSLCTLKSISLLLFTLNQFPRNHNIFAKTIRQNTSTEMKNRFILHWYVCTKFEIECRTNHW